MKAYPEYNDSGVAWIGMIPKHWEVGKIRNLLSLSTEKTKSNGGDLLSLSQYTGVSRKADNDVGIRASEDTTGYNIVKKGQFVMNIMLAWNGSYAVSNYDGIISPAYCVFDFTKECSKPYYNYLLRLPVYAGAFKTESKGIIESRLRLYPQYFKNFPLLVPPLSEQRAMAAYLDRVTAEIDRAIGQQQRMIDLLTERKQIIIQRTVTRGLDPNATMKDSGVEWIGEVPEHWKVEPLGRHFTFGRGLPITKADLIEEGIAVISYGQVHAKSNTGTTMSKDLVRFVSPAYLESHPWCLLKNNDFVFADTSEDVSGSGNFAFNDYSERIFAGYHIVVARPLGLLVPKYYAYLFKSNNWRKQVQSLVNGVKVYSIGRGILKKAQILFPSKEEQIAIVAYLDRATAKIDAAIAREQRMIDLLTERKQIIVSEVVTGRINVSNGEQINTAKV